LQDPAAIDRQIEREAAEHLAKKTHTTTSVPTVKTQEETKEEKAALAAEKRAIKEQVKDRNEKSTLRRIRPLSESKAIDSGATFISEAFLFMVAGGLIVFETFRARRKEGIRREQVEDRLSALEDEIRRCREQEEASEEVVKGLKAEVEQLRLEKIRLEEEKELAAEKQIQEAAQSVEGEKEGEALDASTADSATNEGSHE